MYQILTEVYMPQKMDIDGKSKVGLKTHNGSLTCKMQAKLSCVQGMDKLTVSFLLVSKQAQNRAVSNPLLNTFGFSCYYYCKLVSKDRKMMGKFYGIFSEVNQLLHQSPSPESMSTA